MLLLHVLSVLSGLLALLARELPADVSLLLIAGFTIALTLLGIHIARVKVYAQNAEECDRPAGDRRSVAAFLVDLSYKRRLFEVLLDVVLIALSYAAANVLFYGPGGDERHWQLITSALPLLIFLKLGAFLVMGVYRGLWRYVGVNDLWVYGKGVALGSVLSVLAFVVLYRFDGFSRTVFLLDSLILLLLLTTSRFAFRLLRAMLPLPHAGGRRALIYGAGDAGELLLNEMRNNPKLGCVPVGFADDDPLKKGKVIHGLRVFGGNGMFTTICRANQVEEVYISSAHFPEARVREIRQVCEEAGVALKRMRMSFETLAGDETGTERGA